MHRLVFGSPPFRAVAGALCLCALLGRGLIAEDKPEQPQRPRAVFGGGFGGGVGADGLGSQFPFQAVGNSHAVEVESLLVAVSNSGKTLWGFNNAEKRWVSRKIEGTPVKPEHLTVSTGVAIAIAGNKAYGFGASSQKWDVVTLEGITPDTEAYSVLGLDVACVVAGTKVHSFGADSDRFATTDLSPTGGQPFAPTVGRRRVRVDCGQRIHVFTSGGAGWSVIDLDRDE